MRISMERPAARALAASGLAIAFAASMPAAAMAADLSFTIQGTVTSPTPALGYTTGSALSFTWVLDESAVNQARLSAPGGCCSGTFSWFQDLFSSTPQLWRSITGTGLSGSWQPPTTGDTGDVGLGAGTFPQPYNGGFAMQATDGSGLVSGLRVNGLNVTGLQMGATFLGLDAVGALGVNTVFGQPPLSASQLLGALEGTYLVDRTFSDMCAIWANGPGGGQFRFRVDSLTIATAVPEPGTWALWLAGVAALAGMARRR